MTAKFHLYTIGCLCVVGNNWHRHWNWSKWRSAHKRDTCARSHRGSRSWGVGKPRTEQCPLDTTGPLDSWTLSWGCLHKPCIKSSQSIFQHEGAGPELPPTAMSYRQLLLEKGNHFSLTVQPLVDQSSSHGWPHTHEHMSSTDRTSEFKRKHKWGSEIGR